MKKKIILIILLLFISINVYAKDNSKKIYDYASALTPKQEEVLLKKINKYIEKNNTDVALILIKHTDFETLEEYSKEFADSYKVGMDNNFNGVIFVINVEENDRYIYALNDDNYYNETNIKGFLKESSLLELSYYDQMIMFLSNSTDYSKMTIKDIIIVFFLSLLLDSIILLIIIRPKKSKKKEKENILKIINIEEKHISTKTKKDK